MPIGPAPKIKKREVNNLAYTLNQLFEIQDINKGSFQKVNTKMVDFKAILIQPYFQV